MWHHKKKLTKRTHLSAPLQSTPAASACNPRGGPQTRRAPQRPPSPIRSYLNRSHFIGFFLPMRLGRHAPCLIADGISTLTRPLPIVDSAEGTPPGATGGRENGEPGSENRARSFGVPPYRRHPCLLLVRRTACRRRSVSGVRNTTGGGRNHGHRFADNQTQQDAVDFQASAAPGNGTQSFIMTNTRLESHIYWCTMVRHSRFVASLAVNWWVARSGETRPWSL